RPRLRLPGRLLEPGDLSVHLQVAGIVRGRDRLSRIADRIHIDPGSLGPQRRARLKPYTIRCGDCQAKLKVDRPELVGRRVKCPKCGTRILVLSDEEARQADADTLQQPLDPPGSEQGNPEADVDGDAETVGFGDFEDIDSLLAREAPAAAEKSSRSDAAKSETGADVSRSKKSTPKSKPKAETSEAPDASLDPNWLDPNQSWTSAEVETRRRWMIMATIAIVLTLVSVVGIVWIISEFTGGSTVADNNSTTEGEGTGESDPANATDESGESENTSDENEGDSTDDGTDETTMPPEVSPPDTDDASTDHGTDPVNPTGDTPLVPGGGSPNPTIETLPPGFDLGGGGDGPRPFADVLGDLDSLGSIMEETAFDKARVLAEREIRQAYRMSSAIDEVYVERPNARDVKLEEQLALELRGIELPPMSLLDYVDLLSNLTGLAIKIEPDALRAADLTLESQMSVAAEAVTVEQLMTESLGNVGLGWERQGSVLVLSLPNAEVAESRTYSLAGLGALAESNPDLIAEVVRVMVQPGSWGEGSGNSVAIEFGDLVVTQTPLNQWRIERFLDEWRAVGGEAPADGADAESTAGSDASTAEGSAVGADSLAAISSDVEAREVARELLETHLSLEHLQAVPLRELVREIAELTGGEIIVDWTALEAEGWTVETELTCSILDQPLGLALNDTLRPAALSYRVIDGTTLQITTIRDLLVSADVEFFDLSGLQQTGVTPAEIQNEMPLVFRAVGSQNPDKTFFYDPSNGVLISSLPQPKQRALQKFLAAWERFARLEAKR
ncbi:MAG: hypothetical protein KDA83_18985, partial [Planctomycetales bacterium]|nr:hypothetical protein [Planctomycetales bacterium]